MLAVICGVSCVGKSTLMRTLRDQHDFKILPTYMTREIREGESEKFHLPLDEFQRMEKSSVFRYVNNVYGNFYGTPRKEAFDASNAKDWWLIDFPIGLTANAFKDLEYKIIVIQPESNKALENQIVLAEREERITSIFKDFKENYINIEESNIDLKVINIHGKPEYAVKKILGFCKNIQKVY